jgi:hypothetical protein
VAHISPLEGSTKLVSRANRRAIIRYRCAPATVGKVVAHGDQFFQRAWIQDLSISGIGMDLAKPISKGNYVLISIKSNDNRKTFELSAQVMHCSALPHDQWHLGCEFIAPLTPDDLDELL